VGGDPGNAGGGGLRHHLGGGLLRSHFDQGGDGGARLRAGRFSLAADLDRSPARTGLADAEGTPALMALAASVSGPRGTSNRDKVKVAAPAIASSVVTTRVRASWASSQVSTPAPPAAIAARASAACAAPNWSRACATTRRS